MGIKYIPELLPYLQQRMMLTTALVEFSQPILYNATNEPRGMRHEGGEVRCVTRCRFLPGGSTEHFQ